MKKIIYIVFAASVLSAGCSKVENRIAPASPELSQHQFIAVMENTTAEPATKVYRDANFRLHWNSYGGDTITVFTPGYKTLYKSTYLDQNGNAIFTKAGEGVSSTSAIKTNYAVYPSDAVPEIDDNGDLFMELWGGECAAVTENAEDQTLFFKILYGYVTVQVQGSGSIQEVRLKGNNGEILKGPAKVHLEYGKAPEIELLAGGETVKVIKVSADNPIKLSSTVQSITFSVPPVTFTKGFTVEFVDVKGNVIEKTTTESRTVARNVYNKLEPVEINCEKYVSWTDLSSPKANLAVIYTDLGRWGLISGNRHDDFGIFTDLLYADSEGPDLVRSNNGYNWFGAAGEYDKNDNYYNTLIRWGAYWNIIEKATDILGGFDGEIASTQEAKWVMGQARALRAFAYFQLAKNVQFGPLVNSSAPCVPIFDESTNAFEVLKQSTVAEVYRYVAAQLALAIDELSGFNRGSKTQIDRQVAYGLQARVALTAGQYDLAVQSAMAAMDGYSPATIAEISTPTFLNINEHNWIWGYDATEESGGAYASVTAHLRSFTQTSYSFHSGFARINNLLWNKIPASDVRKGWWVDENASSPLVDSIIWPDTNETVANYLSFPPYTNVKFGCTELGGDANQEDMPLMRAEEMILVMAEAYARLGQLSEGTRWLNTLIAVRDAEGIAAPTSAEALLDQVLFQRRVELWGEGFAREDLIRFQKPLVRFHPDVETNWPEAYRFNLPALDTRFIVPIPKKILDTNQNVAQTYSGSMPIPGEGETLLDGITD